ncbi:MAG: hypothetical protein IJ527_08100 [Prevotella sp.]|nr:hypothetical protein [Prevotella sp.]
MKKMLLLTAVVLLTSCHMGRPDINGSKHQPIMHGWTYEQAGEFWLAADLDDERGDATHNGGAWMTAEQLATFKDENVQVNLPLAPDDTNPQPLDGVTYRQADTEGFITFRFNADTLAADTVLTAALAADSVTMKQTMTIGQADACFKEPMYFPQDTIYNCYVQQRGRGIYTLYYITDRGTRNFPDGRLQTMAAVISVYPGADSLVICRGNMLGGAYVKENK